MSENLDAAKDSQPSICENIGAEILALLRKKAEGKWEYYNPYFLLAITEQIESFYEIEDTVVDEWIQEMFSA